MANFTELESFDSGSNYNFGDKMISPSFPRSSFDLSHLVSGTYDNDGIVYPIAWFETLPQDDFDLDVKALVRVLPQVVPLYSRKRLYVYAFYSRLSDLWSNFNTFMKKGYDGNTIKQIPTLNAKNCESGAVQYCSFGHYMGLPAGYDWSDEHASPVTCLPFMAAFRVMRDYFTNKNFYISDRVLLPDDDTRFRLNDDGELLSAKDLGLDFKFVIHDFIRDVSSGSQVAKGYYKTSSGGTDHYRFTMFTHDYPSDRFTSSLPFPQRGDTPSVSIAGSGTSTIGKNSLSGLSILTNTSGKTDLSRFRGERAYDTQEASFTNSFYFGGLKNSSSAGSNALYSNGNTPTGEFVFPSSDTVIPVSLSLGSITLNQLRELSIAQTELEKTARTDGSYTQFILTFFGEKPKNGEDFRPVYIGGTYTNIQFTEVLQTSTQYESSGGTVQPVGSPLGTYGGHGIGSIDNNSYLGHVHCDDYGIITIFACLMPDVYYSQGLDKKWTRLLQSEYMLPERSKLGLIPVKNEELFYSPDDSGATAELKNKYLWAYNNIFDEYRYEPNRITGQIANPSSLNFFPYTQARVFSSLPTWSHDFVQAANIRKDYLAAYSEFAYTAQFRIGINAVRPLPYKPVPASILA